MYSICFISYCIYVKTHFWFFFQIFKLLKSMFIRVLKIVNWRCCNTIDMNCWKGIRNLFSNILSMTFSSAQFEDWLVFLVSFLFYPPLFLWDDRCCLARRNQMMALKGYISWGRLLFHVMYWSEMTWTSGMLLLNSIGKDFFYSHSNLYLTQLLELFRNRFFSLPLSYLVDDVMI